MTINKIIYSTKKLPPEQQQLLSENQFTIIDSDFISIQSKAFSVDVLNDYLIFTSRNTVKQIVTHESFSKIKQKPILCVGLKTKEILQAYSLEIIENANNANELITIIAHKYATSSFTLFCGESRLNTLPDYFTKNNFCWNEYQVYTTALTPHKITENPDALMFFSPSGVESYLLKNKIVNQACFCIGNTTAKALENKTNKIIIASQPSVENVIDDVLKYYTK